MKRFFCVLCVVTAFLGFNLVVLADPHGEPGTGSTITSFSIVIPVVPLEGTSTDSE